MFSEDTCFTTFWNERKVALNFVLSLVKQLLKHVTCSL